MSVSVWEAIFMLVVLKIPLVYLCGVVWWAVRAEPVADGPGGDGAGVTAPLTPCGWVEWRRRRPSRRPVRPNSGPRRRRAGARTS